MIPPLDRDTRYHSLDLWRGLIALWVVLEHASICLQFAPEGSGLIEAWVRLGLMQALQLCLGAPLFFVISGYCVAASADAARRRGTRPSAFFTRRFRRIVPPYWAALFVFVALIAALDYLGLGHWHRRGSGIELASPGELGLGQWLGNLTLTETWRPRVWGGQASVYTGVAWSLCYQEQFFAVCVVALLLAPRRLYGALMAITVALAAYRVMAWDSGRLHLIDGTFLSRWHEFAVGLAVYWRLNVARSLAAQRGVELGLAALLGLALRYGLTSTAATAAFGLALIAVRPWDTQMINLAWLKPLRACGKRSYSLYLIHVPVCMVTGAALRGLGLASFWSLALVAVPIMIAASVGASWLFYHHVERHFAEAPLTKRCSARAQSAIPAASAQPASPGFSLPADTVEALPASRPESRVAIGGRRWLSLPAMSGFFRPRSLPALQS